MTRTPTRTSTRTATPWVLLAARLVLGGVWLWAGFAKLTDPLASVRAVQAYELLPSSVAETVGHTLPAVELVVGLALVLGVMTRGAALISAVLFAAFVIGIVSVWVRGIEIDCGCFGGGGPDPDASSQYPFEIARDLVLLAASLLLVKARPGRLALDTVLFGRRTPSAPDRVRAGLPHDHERV